MSSVSILPKNNNSVRYFINRLYITLCYGWCSLITSAFLLKCISVLSDTQAWTRFEPTIWRLLWHAITTRPAERPQIKKERERESFGETNKKPSSSSSPAATSPSLSSLWGSCFLTDPRHIFTENARNWYLIEWRCDVYS